MGTTTSKVRCDAPPLPPPGQTSLPPPEAPPKADEASQSISDAAAAASAMPTSSIPNPGPYEGAIMPSKRITAIDTHEGFKMDIQKMLSPYFVVIHSFGLGMPQPDGKNRSYSFITQVSDDNGIFMTNIDIEKRAVMGRMHRALFGGIAMAKVQCSVSPEGSNDQLLGELDFGGMTWTGNLKYGSMGGGRVYGMNYYQGITQRLAMGGEGMYIAANGNMLSSYTLKYEMPAPAADDDLPSSTSSITPEAPPQAQQLENQPSSWMCAQLHPTQGMFNMHYKRVVTPNRVTLGAELNMTPTLESTVMLGAEFNLTRSKVALGIDGTGKLQSTLETKLGRVPGVPTLNFSSEVDFASDSMKFGYGLNVG